MVCFIEGERGKPDRGIGSRLDAGGHPDGPEFDVRFDAKDAKDEPRHRRGDDDATSEPSSVFTAWILFRWNSEHASQSAIGRELVPRKHQHQFEKTGHNRSRSG